MSEWLKQLGEDVELIQMGSSLKFCLVAEGRAHLYLRLGPTSLWDTAAAQCVIEESGGIIVGTDWTPISYSHPFISKNPSLIASFRSFKLN